MSLAITEEHQQLTDIAKDFLAGVKATASSRELTNGVSADTSTLWSGMTTQGWQGLHLPESVGGQGYTLAETALVVEQLGYALAPGAFTASSVVSVALDELGTQEQRSALLPTLADGSAIGSLALAADITVGDAVSGTSGPIIGGAFATLVLLVSGDDAVVVPLDAAGVTTATVDALDPTLGIRSATLDGVAVADCTVVAGAAAAVRRIARVLFSAEASGSARATLDMAVEYAKVRSQFGRTIGSFQAVKHHCANMLVQSELATAAVWDAARTPVSDAQAAIVSDVAAATAFSAAIHNAQLNIQLHGGIGFTWEHDAHLYLRRSRALAALIAPADVVLDDLIERSYAGERRSYSLDLPAEAEQYRSAVREFVASYQGTPEADRRRVLAESGYLVPHWRTPFGRAAGAIEQLVIEDEMAEVDQPNLGIGGWVLLTLTQQADEDQIARWVMPSLLGEFQWCQLFSEPGAGSDAAAVSTRGVKVDGGWRVTGQKVWTSGAQDCNRGLATIRTNRDAPKHKGITAMVMDMHAPGVTVRPLREITGESLFNEVFFDDVFVPDSDVVGAVDNGWKVARATLGNERVTIGAGSREGLSAFDLLDVAAAEKPGDVEVSRAIARLVVEEQNMRLLDLRRVVRAVVDAGPGPEGNVTKLLSAEHAQRVTELGMQIAGASAVTGAYGEISFEYLFDRCLSIAGGTSEITRNVIAERLLGLPRDPLNV
ncbi:acyl-CoA dehydrogenase [Rhodococcus cercidiphylli]|uniref:Acyl-CoA dehydrogenase n=1 Tax=Rhodococcus cercidiphylli TaxID=489916 RepID=A0ABU4AWF1_9NOCA|nr:acyl-CoA dehydrogenase [Rhodococcus cercidiphylli]MDV6230567.1 acyl-CoA dehydrogenase [Rhodococcus cercidiphylli]